MSKNSTARAHLEDCQRVVVKIGSRVLVQSNGRPDLRRMRAIAKDVAALRKAGKEVVLVSSGAVSAGMQALSLKSRPSNLPDLQMAAAVGQTKLMAHYDKFFSAERCKVGQVLLTHDDLNDRRRHLNARNTIMNLLRHGIIPIINENDVVSVDELKFSDNDMLAALVTHLIQADLLVLLTTSNGLREPAKGGRTRRASYVRKITKKTFSWVSDKQSHFSIGGMTSKLEAAQMAAKSGCSVIIADGRKTHTLSAVVSGEDVGTLIGRGEDEAGSMSGRKTWIAFFHRPKGTIIVDDGACEAILKKGKSLLPIGIKKVEGDFKTGALVRIQSRDGSRIGQGLVEYSSEQVRKIMGRKTTDIAGILGSKDYDEVIHRDNMAILSDEHEEGEA